MDPRAIAAFILAGLLSPLLGYGAHRLIHWHKTRQAHKFLDDDPLVFEGARFRKLLAPDGGQLLGAGKIVEIESGRVLVASSDDSVQIPFTGVEFQSMYPHWLVADAGPGRGALPAPNRTGAAPEEAYS